MNQLYFLPDTSALWALGILTFCLLALVIALYILRMPRSRIPFPSLSFLEALQVDARRRRRRLRTFLAILLQVLILALLAASAARPLLSSGRLSERRIVLVMDVSASMRARDGEGGKTRFAEAKERAHGIIRQMEYGDRALIIAADSEARIVQQFEKDRRTLYRTINAMQPGFQSTNLGRAFDLLREVIRPLADPQVYLLSDGAETLGSDEYQEVLAKTQLIRVGETRGNIGVVGFSARRNMDSERDFSALVALHNTFEEPRKVAVTLRIGGKPVDVRELELQPRQLHTEAYEKTLLVGGTLKAEVTLPDGKPTDAFPVDNVAYEWIPKTERIKVLVVAPEEELGGYLDASMSANIGVQGYRVTPEKYRRNYDVGAMIFYNWTPPEFPDCDVILVNTRGENPAAHIAEGAILRPLMRTWDRTHPLMNYIGLENLLLASALGAKGTDWMEPVARTVQVPIILAGRRGPQKLVFVGFDPKKSDFPFRLAFPVLVSNSLLWFTQEETGARATQARPDEVYEIRIPKDVRERPETITVVDPLQNKTELKVIGDSAPFTHTHVVGAYTYQLGRLEHGFAVNLADAKESDIGEREGFQQAFAEAKAAVQDAPVVERELWFLLNWIALAFLCVEAYVFHRRILF